ncbi:hypothetical protein B0H15DRAFT_907006 [Mycena belliarum]|uniref:Protein kinase domain-containing protein n=1 Tax=Mycena belliarum TaxID=1033014 RepID=A0AAD6XT43_9AGAR|nr:hypothetical protein B0H15DRAFT_907006 [Mycena belliae]
MTTLTINCALQLRCDRLMNRKAGPLVLKRVKSDFDSEPPAAEEEWTVDSDVETIQSGPRFFVFRAQIIRPAGAALDVVLKIDPTGACEAACKNEAKVYQEAKILRGNALPFFYGCFQVRIDAAMVTCLAIEHCGEPLQTNFRDLDYAFACKLLRTVAALHACGLTHGDLHPRNVRVMCDTPVLIDLESSESHTCGLRMMVVPGTTRPTAEEYGCAELHSLVWRMGLWATDKLGIDTIMLDKDSVRTVDDLTRWIPGPEQCDPDYRRYLGELAEHLFEELCEERMLTWGTTEVSDHRIRRDLYKSAAPSA